MISYIAAGIIAIAGISMLIISKSKFTVPAIILILSVIIISVIYQKWEKISSSIPTFGLSKTQPDSTSPISKSEGMPPEWEMVKNCPIHFVGRIFSSTVGPDGERANTGEVYPDCFLENGYDYKITYSGEYTKRLVTQEHKVSWRGFSPQSQGIEKPFPDYDFGALMLRIGDQIGIHPEKNKDFIVFTTKKKGPMKIFVEVNVNRFPEEYRDSKGSKVKNSTLSLKLERRPL